MRKVQWWTNEWDEMGEEVVGIESAWLETDMTDDELAAWAKDEVKAIIKRDGGEVMYTEDNEIMYECADGTFYAYVWLIIEDENGTYEWDLVKEDIV